MKSTEHANKSFHHVPWRNLLPDVYQWSESVRVQSTESMPDKAFVVVVLAETKEESTDATFNLNAPSLDTQLQAKIIDAVKQTGWCGVGSQMVQLGGLTVLVVAPTKVPTSSAQKSRAIGIDAAKILKQLNVETVVLCKGSGLCSLEMFLGLGNGLYQCKGFKGSLDNKDKKPALAKTVLLLGTRASSDEIERTKWLLKSVILTRHLQDAPANYLDPVRFGMIGEEVAKEVGLKCKVYDKEGIQALGMGSFLSVNAGSAIEPRMIVIEIDGKDQSKTIALCGKGLTFDAGGISLKPAQSMEEMKYDMSGGAAVLGAAHYLAKVQPPTRVVCIIGCTENLLSATATKPGDIVVAMNGKTIEVQNTDAEGRLVLADLLHFAVSVHKADRVVDIATLTGAVLVALGTVGAAVLSNDDSFTQEILEAARASGEPLWQLPMWPELEQETRGTYADLNNIAKPSVKAGTIIGAMFLKEFVGKAKWAHLDIAGTAWDCKAVGYPSSGGCAYGLRTLIQTVLRFNS